MKLTDLTPNPDNPRHIRDEKFSKLVDSIRTFDKMMRLRPMVVDMDGVILGGNMRYRALQHLGIDDIPDNWVIQADLTEDEKREFIIKDNVAFGEWDWDTLANDWGEPLDNWGVDIPNLLEMPTDDELIGEEKDKPATMKITFASAEQLQMAEIDIQKLIDLNYKGAYYSVSYGAI